MKIIRFVATLAAVAALTVPLAADVTVTSVVSMEAGGPAGSPMGGMTPRMVMRIKGLKSRIDVDVNGQTNSSITDLNAKQLILLQTDQKTAQVLSTDSVSALAPAAAPKVDATSKPTGRSQTIAGVSCDEFDVVLKVSMAEMSGSSQMGPEATAMLKDVTMVMTGSMWVAKQGPGVADYVAFQKAAAAAQLGAGGLGSSMPGMRAGFDRLLSSFSGINGLPYLTELKMSVEGTGPMVEMMKKMGGMKMSSKVVEVSTDSLADDLFAVPPDYKVVKQ